MKTYKIEFCYKQSFILMHTSKSLPVLLALIFCVSHSSLFSQSSKSIIRSLQSIENVDEIDILKTAYPDWNIQIVELKKADSVNRPKLYFGEKGEIFAFGNQSKYFRILQPGKLAVCINKNQNADYNVIKLGRYELLKSTIGQSGSNQLKYENEWALQIPYEGVAYRVVKIGIHLSYNTLDSIAFKFNLYESEGRFPGKSVLNKSIGVKAYKNDNWIYANVSDQNITIDENVFLSCKIDRPWWSEKGENQLFFSQSIEPISKTSVERNPDSEKWFDDPAKISLKNCALFLIAEPLDNHN